MYGIGDSLNLFDILTVQIAQSKIKQLQYFINFYLNQNFITRLIIKTHNDYQPNQKHKVEIIEPNIIPIKNQFQQMNYKIKNVQNYKSPPNKSFKSFQIFNKISDLQLCSLKSIQDSNQQFIRPHAYQMKDQRILSTIQFIHGSNMRSIVRNIYQNQQSLSIIASAQSQTAFMVIGYFFLKQTITTPLPIITIGVLEENNNFLNLYILSDDTVELKYIHDSSNIIKLINLRIQSLQDQWVSFGIIYDKSSSKALFVYSNAQSQLTQSSSIQNAYLPTTIQSFDVCISCIFYGGVFDRFIGKYSTVKIIYGINVGSINNYFFFNEATEIDKKLILDSSFNLNNYIQNSEYDINQGFNCNLGYAFFEGICINTNNCKNLIQESDKFSSFESGKFYDSTSKKCINCGDNCLQCTSNLNCIICREGFISNSGNNLRCNNTTNCNTSCSGQQIFDPFSYACRNEFDITSHIISNPLISQRILNDISEVHIYPLLQIEYQIVHCYIDTNNNPMTIHSFLGGTQYTTSTVLNYLWTNIPSGYQKSVSFYVLFYNNGNPSNLQVQINSNISQLVNSNLISDQTQCSGGLQQMLKIFKVQFMVKDYKQIFDLQIKNNSNGWGIRNISVEVFKCHPTCNSCLQGGGVSDCTTCRSEYSRNRFQCQCQNGFYAKYKNCFDSYCAICTQCQVSNCLQCEDITGDCTQCQQGFVIEDGQCTQESDCTGDLKVLFESKCGLTKDIAINHFQNNKIVQYADYWQFADNNITLSNCYSLNCMPLLQDGQAHSIQLSLPDLKSYHYFLNISMDVFPYQILSWYGRGFSIYLNDKKIFTSYYTFIKNTLHNTKSFKTEYIKTKSIHQSISFEFKADTEEDKGYYSFKNVVFYYERCHPICKTCSDTTLESCITCIDNANMVDGYCQCKDGFYFQLVTLPNGQDLPGRCLQCNDSCKTCIGPSSLECTYCQDGYQEMNGVCFYKCEENQYWDQQKQSCVNCHICCRTCKSGSINDCHDCYQDFIFILQDYSCMIYNAKCQPCTVAFNFLCGGSVESHNSCIKNSWVVLNSNVCVNCGQFANNFCGGNQSEVVIQFCKRKGYYNHDSQNCSSCQNLISNNCGRFEIKDTFLKSGWVVKNSKICINCSIQMNGQCSCDLTQDDIKICQKNGFLNYDSDNCSSCVEVVSQTCGRSEIKDRCNNNKWTVFDQNTCINCGIFINGKCGAKSIQIVIDFCQQQGFYNYDENNCSSCQEVSFDKCGRNEINERCFVNGWDQLNQDTCINCNLNSLTYNSCVCHNTWQTCSRFFSKFMCTSCNQNLYFFNGQCLTKCPNGFKINGQNCDPCSDIQMPSCFNCYKTCQICSPFEVSQIPNSCISCSNLTRFLQNGECKCQDPEDNRQIFHECSYQSIAVIIPILSNTNRVLSIDFGKRLNIPSDFESNKYSQSLCFYLFSSSTLKLFGSTFECSIFLNSVFVNIDSDSLIFHGDLIYFTLNILSFQASSSIMIDKYLNNIVIQEQLVGEPLIEFVSLSTYNSCDNINIIFKQINNGAQRGFHEFQWSLVSFSPSDLTYQTLLNNILQNANQEKNLNLVIQNGIIEVNTQVQIMFDYTLKANYQSNLQFSFTVKLEKKIKLDFQTTIMHPFYRYNSGMIVIIPSIRSCLEGRDQITNESINLQISSEYTQETNILISSEQQYFYSLEIKPYQFQVGNIIFSVNYYLNTNILYIFINIILQVKANLLSDLAFMSLTNFNLQVEQSKLYVKLIGGNAYFDYKKDIIIKGEFKDYDNQNKDDPHNINIYWKCFNFNNQTPCTNRFGDLIDIPSFKETALIQGYSFDPYNVIQILLIGEKNNRKSNDSINIFVSELDLPPLEIKISTKDPMQETVNLNDEIFVEIDYMSDVNVDSISFSGAISYENEIVGNIKIDYSSFRFKIQDYYSDFKKDLCQIELKVSAFNPEYYMPSQNVKTLTLNLSPINCKLTIISNNPIIALETQLKLVLGGCQDQNQPIQYQFFYYKNTSDFENERINPNKVTRRQIQDKQASNVIYTILPSGEIIVLAQAIDSKNAIFNTTISIKVEQKKYDEQLYLQILQSKIDQINSMQSDKAASELIIACDDFLSRSEFKQNSSINQKFKEILNSIIKMQQKKSPLSTYITLVDKAIISILESKIDFTEKELTELLSQLIQTLDQNSNPNQLNLEISKEILRQKIYDSFLIIDNLPNHEKHIEKLLQVINRIGLYSFKIILPNEDMINYQGNNISIQIRQITEKYICSYFLCQNQTKTMTDNKQTTIYDFTQSKFNKNPYSQDSQFLNYTNSFSNKTSNQSLSQYPLITPSLYSYEQKPIENFSKKIAIDIQSQSDVKQQKKMVCISKEDQSMKWTKDRCQSSYNNENKSYQCVCQKLSATTIIEDFSDIIQDSNLNVAFGSEGISNISNFSDFYEYVIFWLLVIQILVFIYLFFVGFLLDKSTSISRSIQQNLDQPQQVESVKTPLFSKSKILPSDQIQNQILNDINNYKKQLKQCNQTSQHSPLSISPLSTNEQISLKDNNNKVLELNTGVSIFLNNQNQTPSRMLSLNLEQMTPYSPNKTRQSRIQFILSPKMDVQKKIDINDDIMINSGQQEKVLSNDNIKQVGQTKQDQQQNRFESFQKLFEGMKQLRQTNPDQQKNRFEQFEKLSKFKQVIVLHNFFGIFYLYNPTVSRKLRLLFFYLRSIHSLCISQIFDQQYSIIQKIVITVVNSILIILVIKILEKIIKFTSKLQILKSVIIVAFFILGYYYVIIAIASGQSSDESNKFIGTFFLFYFGDVFIFAFFSAFIQRMLIKLMIKNQASQGITKQLYKLMEINLLLLQIDAD